MISLKTGGLVLGLGNVNSALPAWFCNSSDDLKKKKKKSLLIK